MNNLIQQMEKDASAIPQNALGKIGAVATDIADTQEEISKLKEQLQKKEDYERKLSREVLPSLFSEVGLSELKLSDGRKIKVSEYYTATPLKENRKLVDCYPISMRRGINLHNANGSNLPPYALSYVSNMWQAGNFLWIY
jgi:hypothetical protein